MMTRTLAVMAILMLLSGCGLKRPLELPGHEKHVNQNDATPNTPNAPAAPDSVSTTVPLTSSSNPASGR